MGVREARIQAQLAGVPNSSTIPPGPVYYVLSGRDLEEPPYANQAVTP